jgi:hypothetical protein
MLTPGSWNLELEGKPDFEKAMQRIYAWYYQEMIDRSPIRFSADEKDQPAIIKRTEKW